MYILFFSILLCIIGVVILIIGIRKERQDLLTLESRKRDYLEKQLKDLLSQETELIKRRDMAGLECGAAKREQQIERERLEELRHQSREVLRTEKERLQSELELTQKLKLQQLQQEYKAKSEVLEEDFQQKKYQIDTELSSCQKSLDQFKQIQDSVNEAIRRKKELEEQEYFYSIDVSENDQEDISILQSMDARLHNRDVIPKLVWELFIRRPTQEMIKRVTGGKDGSGIYKITYKKTGEAYIGKTTSFSTRWQNHIKTAIGLEAAARATLHNRMAKDGLWNYTFEILERVDKEHLSAREAYYIDLYGTKNQLNMKSGDKNGTQ